ncbi:MAG: hypothetical protein IT167_19390 [Bryobacterales bacterium]|nr:hypothetical protein [Bryobacterales bacterium]
MMMLEFMRTAGRGLGACMVFIAAHVASSQDSKRPQVTQVLNAEIVLTQEFCRTKIARGSRFNTPTFRKEWFEVGKPACAHMESSLRYVFAKVTRVGREPMPGETSAHVVITPKFVDLNATRPGGPVPALSDRELIVLLEWTAKDANGRPVWTETIEGSAVHRLGSVFENGRKRIVEDAVIDLLRRSALKMSNSVELQQVAR